MRVRNRMREWSLRPSPYLRLGPASFHISGCEMILLIFSHRATRISFSVSRMRFSFGPKSFSACWNRSLEIYIQKAGKMSAQISSGHSSKHNEVDPNSTIPEKVSILKTICEANIASLTYLDVIFGKSHKPRPVLLLHKNLLQSIQCEPVRRLDDALAAFPEKDREPQGNLERDIGLERTILAVHQGKFAVRALAFERKVGDDGHELLLCVELQVLRDGRDIHKVKCVIT